MTADTASLWRVRAHETLTRALEGPMLVLSIGFLVVLIWPRADPHMAASTRTALNDADWGIWAAFAVEYVALLVTAPQRCVYVRTHLLDLAIVVLPMLRPLRIVRSVRLLRLLRLARLSAIAAESVRRSRTAFFSRAVVFAFTLGALVVLSAAAVVLDLERQAPARTSTHSVTRCDGR